MRGYWCVSKHQPTYSNQTIEHPALSLPSSLASLPPTLCVTFIQAGKELLKSTGELMSANPQNRYQEKKKGREGRGEGGRV